jgi:hypothetical protein
MSVICHVMLLRGLCKSLRHGSIKQNTAKRYETQNARHTLFIIFFRRQVLQLQLLRQVGQLFAKSSSVKWGYLFRSCHHAIILTNTSFYCKLTLWAAWQLNDKYCKKRLNKYKWYNWKLLLRAAATHSLHLDTHTLNSNWKWTQVVWCSSILLHFLLFLLLPYRVPLI